MINRRIMTLMGLLFYGVFTLSASAQSLSPLHAQQVWQYGRGVIYDFGWNEQNVVFPAGGKIWRVDPLSGETSTEEAADFFPLLTSPDGMRFVSQGRSEMLIQDTRTNTTITRIPRSYFARGAAAWRPNTNLLTTHGYNEENPPESRYFLELWDTHSAELVGTIGGYANGIRDLSWHPEGNLLAVSEIGGTIIIEDVAGGERIHTLVTDTTSRSVAWSPDGTRLAATVGSSPVHVWQADTFQPITSDNQPAFILTIAWNADSARLAGALPRSGVGVWNIDTGEFTLLGIEADDGIDRVVEHIAWQGNLLAALDRTQRLRVWNVDNHELVWDSSQHQFHSSVRGMAVSQDGALVALGYYNSRAVDILDGQTGALIQTLEAPHRLDISEMAWSPSGQQLAVASTTLYLWSFEPDAPATPIEVADVNYVSWSPDGLLAVASTYHLSGEVRVINGQTGEQIEAREVPREVAFPRWSPNGRYIAMYRYNSPSDDDTIPRYQIDIWDRQRDVTTTVNLPASDQYTMTPSQYFVWLPDSSGLMGYTSGALWRWTIGATEGEILVPHPDVDTTNQSFPLSINASGNLLAVSNVTTEGQVHILDAASGRRRPLTEDILILRLPFSWGGDDMLFADDGVLRAYRIQFN